MEKSFKDIISELISLQFSPKLENLGEIKCIETELITNQDIIDELKKIIFDPQSTDKEIIYSLKLIKRAAIFWAPNFEIIFLINDFGANAKNVCRSNSIMYVYSRFLAFLICLNYFYTTNFHVPKMEVNPLFLRVMCDVLDIIQNEEVPNVPKIVFKLTPEEIKKRVSSLRNSMKKHEEKVFEYVPFFMKNYLGTVYSYALETLCEYPESAIELLNAVLLFSKKNNSTYSIVIPINIYNDFINPLPNDSLKRNLLTFIGQLYNESEQPFTSQIIKFVCTIIRATSHSQKGALPLLAQINELIIQLLSTESITFFANLHEISKCIKACNFLSSENDNSNVINQIIELSLRCIGEDAANDLEFVKETMNIISKITLTYYDSPYIGANKDLSNNLLNALFEQAKAQPRKVENNILVGNSTIDKILPLVWKSLGDDAIPILDAQFSLISPSENEYSNIVMSSLLFYFINSLLLHSEFFSSPQCVSALMEKSVEYAAGMVECDLLSEMNEKYLVTMFDTFFGAFPTRELFNTLVEGFTGEHQFEEFVSIVFVNFLKNAKYNGEQAISSIFKLCKYDEIREIIIGLEEMHSFIENIYINDANQDEYTIASLFSFFDGGIRNVLINKLPKPTKNPKEVVKYFGMSTLLFKSFKVSDWISFCSLFLSNWNVMGGWLPLIRELIQNKRDFDSETCSYILNFIIKVSDCIPKDETFPTKSKYGFLFFKIMLELSLLILSNLPEEDRLENLILSIESVNALLCSPIGNIGISIFYNDNSMFSFIDLCIKTISKLNPSIIAFNPKLVLVATRFISNISCTCQDLLTKKENEPLLHAITSFMLIVFNNPSQELMDTAGYALLSLMKICFDDLGPHYILAIETLPKIENIKILGSFIIAYTDYDAGVTIELTKLYQKFFVSKEMFKKARILCNYLFKDIEEEPNFLEEFRKEYKNFGIEFTSIRSICQYIQSLNE